MANPILYNGQASPQSIYEVKSVTHSDQEQPSASPDGHKIGTRAYLPDGRVFYMASNGAVALTAGSLLSVPATTGLNISATDNDIILTDSSGNFSVGAKRMVLQESDVDSNDIVKDVYAEGYLYVEVSTGLGTYYKIAAHDAFDASGTSTAKQIELYDPIQVALAATSGISFAKNPYTRVVTSTTAEEEAPVGVCVTPGGVTDSGALPTDVTAASNEVTTYFFWAQTWGPCAVEVDDTTVASGIAVVSGDTADRVEAAALTEAAPNTGFDQLQIGVGLVSAAGAAGETVLIDLRIRP